MADFGGTMRFTYDSIPLRMRGKFDSEPTSSEFKEITNQDGSIDREQTPMPHVLEVTFVDTDDSDDTYARPTSLPWEDIMKGGRRNISIVEESNGIIHTATRALFVGRPKVDRMKGEVTGIRIVAPRGQYKQTTAA